MQPATEPPARRDGVVLLAVDTAGEIVFDSAVDALPDLLEAGDVLVVNDAATLPASLAANGPAGEPLEMRLLGSRGDRWRAVLFGAGDWRDDTDTREPPPRLEVGDAIDAGGLRAFVTRVSTRSVRLVELAFDREGAALWQALYQRGTPVQYSHLRAPLELWSVQTAFAARPWAAEMPSAGRPLSWRILLSLRRRGVQLTFVTHAAGLSATGDPALDGDPFPERFDVPARAVSLIEGARARGKRVIATGTTVVRALEGCAAQNRGRLVAGTGETDLVIGPGFSPRIVDGLITGMHVPGESHYRLLEAFVPSKLLARSIDRATELGYRSHELGDLALFAPRIAHTTGARRQPPKSSSRAEATEMVSGSLPRRAAT